MIGALPAEAGWSMIQLQCDQMNVHGELIKDDVITKIIEESIWAVSNNERQYQDEQEAKRQPQSNQAIDHLA